MGKMENIGSQTEPKIKKESEVKDNQEESENINIEESVKKQKLTSEELKEIRKERREKRQEKIAKLKEKKKRTKADKKELGNLEKREFFEDIIAARKKLISLEKNSDEYEEAKIEYSELRAQYVAHNEERALIENQRVVRDQIIENSKEKGLGTKFYEAYKKMGEWNLGKLLGSKVMEKLESKEDDSRLNKIGKGILRFSTKMVSVRTGISFGLLAAGGAIGGGALLAGGIVRKMFATAGASFGAYDLMKAMGDESKGKFKELNTEEVESKDTEELYTILDNLDSKALLNNEKGYRGKTYNLIKDEIVKRAKEKEKPENEKSTKEQEIGEEKISKKELEVLIKDREELRDNVLKELKTSEIRRKVKAAGIGLFIGSGAFASLCSKGVNSVMGLFEEAGETSDVIIASDIETADTVVETTETADTVVESIAEVKSGDTVWKLSEDQLAKRIDNWDSLSEAQQTHMIDMVKDKVVADPGSFGLDAARENIFNSPAADILKVGDKINFSEAFTDTNITSEIDKLGALGSGEGLTTLSGVQEANILSNNEVLAEATKEGIHIDSANVNMVAEEMKRSGSDFIAKEASLGTKISPFSVDGEPVTIASNNTTHVFQNSGEAVPTEQLVNRVSHPNAQEILEKLGVKNTEQFLSLESFNALASAESGVWTDASYAALKDNPEKLTEAFKSLITSGDQEGIKSFIADFGQDNNFNFTETNDKAAMFTRFLGGIDGKIDINDLGDNIDNLDSNVLNDLMSKFDESVVTDIKDIGKGTVLGIVDDKYAYINKINRIWPLKDTFNYEFANGDSGTVKGIKVFTEHFSSIPEPAPVDTTTIDTSTVTPEPATGEDIINPNGIETDQEVLDKIEEINKEIEGNVEGIDNKLTDVNQGAEDIVNSAEVKTPTVEPEVLENSLTANNGTVLEFTDKYTELDKENALKYFNTRNEELNTFPKALAEWEEEYGSKPEFANFKKEVLKYVNSLKEDLNSFVDKLSDENNEKIKTLASGMSKISPEKNVETIISEIAKKMNFLSTE